MGNLAEGKFQWSPGLEKENERLHPNKHGDLFRKKISGRDCKTEAGAHTQNDIYL